MSIELSSDRIMCFKCGKTFKKYRGLFPVSYASLHKGVGYIPICRECVESMYNTYLAQCNDPRAAVRQMCRKLDLFWSDMIYDYVSKKSTTRSMMTQYITRVSTIKYAGKSYDDTLSSEGTLWNFGDAETKVENSGNEGEGTAEKYTDEGIEVPEEVVAFWGTGYSPSMYMELEQRREYWMSNLPEDYNVDAGTEALLRQICPLELDINKRRSEGKSVMQMVANLNTLIGSMNLKPSQKKQDDADLALLNTPLGVWLDRYENKRPLPEVDDDLKDVNHLKRYIFTWMGHLCKMLGIKNTYSKLYEDEIERLRVEMPEYDGDDDEVFMNSLVNESTKNGGNDE